MINRSNSTYVDHYNDAEKFEEIPRVIEIIDSPSFSDAINAARRFMSENSVLFAFRVLIIFPPEFISSLRSRIWIRKYEISAAWESVVVIIVDISVSCPCLWSWPWSWSWLGWPWSWDGRDRDCNRGRNRRRGCGRLRLNVDIVIIINIVRIVK